MLGIYKIHLPVLYLYDQYILRVADKLLLSEKGWVNRSMTAGVKGLVAVVDEMFKRWSADQQGNLVRDLKARGVCLYNIH